MSKFLKTNQKEKKPKINLNKSLCETKWNKENIQVDQILYSTANNGTNKHHKSKSENKAKIVKSKSLSPSRIRKTKINQINSKLKISKASADKLIKQW